MSMSPYGNIVFAVLYDMSTRKTYLFSRAQHTFMPAVILGLQLMIHFIIFSINHRNIKNMVESAHHNILEPRKQQSQNQTYSI